jgi:hypothetical protein
MSTIVTRAGKGSALTWTEGDANITNLNNDKMENFTVAGDSGTSQTVSGGNTLTISGGTGLSSVASATDTITLNLDNTAVTAASYTYANITVDAQGRITAASSGATPLTSGGALGTPASGNLQNCTADGTNGVGFRSIPSAGAGKTSSYTLATSDRGEFVQVDTGGSITVPNSTFAAGDVVLIYNNTTGNITITTSAVAAYIGGVNTLRSSVTLATRGVCNILYQATGTAILTGNVT